MASPLRVRLLGEQIVDDLRAQVIHGEILKGERLVETEVAQRYDVSRGPVRDALSLLANEGLVEKGRQGYVVRGLSEKDVRDIYEVRTAFEEISASHIAEDPGSAEWRGMELAVADMKNALESGDTNRYAQADLAFHDELIKSSRNLRMIGFWATLMPTFSVMLQVTNAQDVDLTPSFDDHVAILDSLKAGKSVDVETLINRHLDGSLNRMVRAIAQIG
ncbi:GntR family transcriptional regulator [Bifidobacterium margollesii]|uniref:GntR family transcriptional regulator n=1 Tax=Bifidobacterium margollesii TaxID=2020964 RepID=A0A2N5JB72_9BIFI|nr:GntR family transcriptional regulator [Bifidobacterium margollesii]PLS31463.1 GntR family transcriptional regulator [Bifidobacterium margollesii]